MAKSYNSYVGNGSTNVFSLTFPYLAKSHVKVYVGGVEDTTFTWLTSSSLTLTAVPANGAIVLIKRVTPTTPLIDFVDGSVVTESLLDTATIQSMYVAEETQDTAATAIIFDPISNKWQGNAKVLTNIADPVDAQDAVTKHWAQTAMDSELAQATAQANTATTKASEASASATSAASSATTATTKASEASTSATNSANSATASAASATASAASASTASTKAGEAATSATNAAGSASTANTKATEASNSASSASSSATSASNSASTATAKATEATTGAATATAKASEASSSATSAASSASSASTSATNASASATTATTKATEAASSASSAASSAATVASNTTAAANSATSAATSASDAAVSATSAASSAASAAALLDNFDDRYLGAKSSAPSVDNDGNALLVGALYFDSTTGKMRVYTASGWLDASSATVATLAKFEYVATAGQTSFSGTSAGGTTLTYTVGAIVVSLNGALLRSTEFTATNGTSVVLASGASVGDELVIYAFGNFLVADTYSRAEADALLANKLSNANNSVLPAKLANSGYELGMRNRVINGSMQVWQRGVSYAVQNSWGYGSVDRWAFAMGGTPAATASQVASGLAGFQYAVKLARNSAATSTGQIYTDHVIENANTVSLQGQTVTLSFYAKAGANFSASSNTLMVALYTGTGGDSNSSSTSMGGWTGATQPINGSCNLTTSWVRYSFTGTIPANATNIGLMLSYLPTGTAGADDALYFTGVQLEIGSVATPFDYRHYGQELQLCQRYYTKLTSGNAASGGIIGLAVTLSTTVTVGLIPFRQQMRATPTISFANMIVSDSLTFDSSVSAITGVGTYDSLYLSLTHAASTAGKTVSIRAAAGSTGYLAFESEL